MKFDKGLAKGITKFSFIALSLMVLGFFVVNFVLPSLAYSGSSICTATGAYNVCTDYSDYAPTEVATVTGSGFNGFSYLQIKVIRPDGTSSTGNDVNTQWPTSYDTVNVVDGKFTYVYNLDGILGTYTIQVIDGENVLAIHTFTDNIGYDKSGYDKGSASWGTGNQAGYSENDWVQYQYTITGITGSVPNFNIIYDEQVSGRIFIDALSNFRVCVDCPYATASSVLDNNFPRPPSTDGTPDAHGNLWYSFTPLNINYAHTNHQPNAAAACSAPDPVNAPSAEHCFLIDPTIIHATYSHFPASFTSGTHTVTIFYEAHMAATFVWSTGHESSLGNDATIYGVHAPTSAVLSGVSYGTGLYSGWTTTSFTGAGGGGSNKHFNIADQSAGSGGAITLPIPAVTLPTGSIKIIKDAVPNNTQDFTFTSSFGDFTLDDDGVLNNPLNNSITFGNLIEGDYSFTETSIPAGWGLTSVVCSANQTDTNPVSVHLGAVGSITCTFTDTLQLGTLTVIKHVINNNGGTATASSFSLHVKSGGVDVAGSPHAGSETGNNYTLNSGTYVVSEDPLAGYNQIGFSGDCDSGGSVTVVAGQTKTCTITNDDIPGQIRIIKNTVGGDGRFNFTVSGPNSSTPSILTSGGTGTTGFIIVNAGSYSALETVPSGWALTSSSCTSGTPGSFRVPLDGSVTCTFNNTKLGTIIVEKQTIPDASIGSFIFTGNANGTISDNGQIVVNNLLPGTYHSTESNPSPAFLLTSIVCNDTDSSGVVGTRIATFNLQAGEVVKCTFTNTKQPTLTVNKILVPGADSGLFNLQIDSVTAGTGANVGNGGTTGVQIVSIGNHTVGETA